MRDNARLVALTPPPLFAVSRKLNQFNFWDFDFGMSFETLNVNKTKAVSVDFESPVNAGY
jgi:hypothetical protein